MITSTARQEFQDHLRQALDTYHPRWELGIKGKELKHSRQMFTTVAYETLRDWVSSVKGQCPQQKSFQSFLAEAEFPEEISNTIWTLYLAFKRERKQGNQPRSSLLASLKQFTTQQNSLSLIGETKNEDDHATMRLTTSILQKEYMHENDWQHYVENSEDERRAKLEGVYGVSNKVNAAIQVALESAIDRFASDPTLQEITDDILADAIMMGLQKAVDRVPKANVLSRISEVRKGES